MKYMQNLAVILGIFFLLYFLGVKISGGYGTNFYFIWLMMGSYSHMDQKDLPCAGMFGMSVVRTGGRVDFERIYGEGRCGAGLCDCAGGADERAWAEPCAADAAGYGV